MIVKMTIIPKRTLITRLSDFGNLLSDKFYSLFLGYNPIDAAFSNISWNAAS